MEESIAAVEAARGPVTEATDAQLEPRSEGVVEVSRHESELRREARES